MTQTYWKPVKISMCMALEKMYRDKMTGVVSIPDTGLSVDFTDRDEVKGHIIAHEENVFCIILYIHYIIYIYT